MPSLKGSTNPSYKHGHSCRGKKSKIYTQFMNIKARCHIKSNKDYCRYGAKGVAVCDRWLYGDKQHSGFEYFLLDMGEPPLDKPSLDRIDNTLGYSPDNCRWADSVQQANNKATNHRLEIDGVSHTLAEWSRLVGIGSKTILHRITHQGLSPKDAVYRPLMWTKKK